MHSHNGTQIPERTVGWGQGAAVCRVRNFGNQDGSSGSSEGYAETNKETEHELRFLAKTILGINYEAYRAPMNKSREVAPVWRAVATHIINAPMKMQMRRPRTSATKGIKGRAAKDPKVYRTMIKNSRALDLNGNTYLYIVE